MDYSVSLGKEVILMTIEQRQKLDRKYREMIQAVDNKKITFESACSGMEEIISPRSISDLNIYSEQQDEDENEGQQ